MVFANDGLKSLIRCPIVLFRRLNIISSPSFWGCILAKIVQTVCIKKCYHSTTTLPRDCTILQSVQHLSLRFVTDWNCIEQKSGRERTLLQERLPLSKNWFFMTFRLKIYITLHCTVHIFLWKGYIQIRHIH